MRDPKGDNRKGESGPTSAEIERWKALAEWGETFTRLKSALERAFIDDELDVYEIRLKACPNQQGFFLAFCKARTLQLEERIAFSSAKDPAAALYYLVSSLVDGSTSWRESKPWTPQGKAPLGEPGANGNERHPNP